MVAKRTINETDRLRIYEQRQNGKSLRRIAEMFKVSKTAVAETIERFQGTGSHRDRKRSGRPRKTTKALDRIIVREMEKMQSSSADKVAEQLRHLEIADISPSLVRRRMVENNMHSLVKMQKPLLTEKHKKARIEFAKTFIDRSQSFWDGILWSDETKISISGSDGKAYCWKRLGTNTTPKHVKQTVKYPTSLMVWGCFSASGVGEICIIDGKMDSAKYQNILRNHLRPSALKLIGEDYVFQQDNDPKHTSKSTKAWFESNRIEVLPWPSQSPDLNPIENLWAKLKKEIAAYHCRNRVDLEQAIKSCWNSISSAFCKKLVESMPRRLDQVILRKGLWTDY